MKHEYPTWLNWALETLLRQMENEPLNGLGYHTPPWLETVQTRVIQECFGRIIGIEHKPQAYRDGFLNGWLERGLRDSEEHKNALPKCMEETAKFKQVTGGHQKNKELETVTDSEFEEVEAARKSVAERYEQKRNELSTEELELS